MRIALFGGTFDPVHLGHIAMAKAAHEAMQLDQVRFLPCQISPHKQESPPTPTEHRIEMLERATEGLPWALVDDFETHSEGPSYSWNTAETLKSHFPDDQLFWIMGSDQWASLDRWDQPDRLAACVEFIVFLRDHDPQPEPREGYRLHSLPGIHPAGSTSIREHLANGIQDNPWLDPKVSEWIEMKSLYLSTS